MSQLSVSSNSRAGIALAQVPNDYDREEVILAADLNTEPTEDAPPLPDIADAEAVERHLRTLAYWERQQSIVDATAQRELKKIGDYVERQTKINQFHIQRHGNALQAFLLRAGQRSLPFVNGIIKLVKGRERVEIPFPEQALAWAKDHAPQLIRTKEEIDKVAVKKFVDAAPDGLRGLPDDCIAIVRAPDEFKVETFV